MPDAPAPGFAKRPDQLRQRGDGAPPGHRVPHRGDRCGVQPAGVGEQFVRRTERGVLLQQLGTPGGLVLVDGTAQEFVDVGGDRRLLRRRRFVLDRHGGELQQRARDDELPLVGIGKNADLLGGARFAVLGVERLDPALDGLAQLLQGQRTVVREQLVQDRAREQTERSAPRSDEVRVPTGRAGVQVRDPQGLDGHRPPARPTDRAGHGVAPDTLPAGVDEEQHLCGAGVLDLAAPVDGDAAGPERLPVAVQVLRYQIVHALGVQAVSAQADQQCLAPPGLLQEARDLAVHEVPADPFARPGPLDPEAACPQGRVQAFEVPGDEGQWGEPHPRVVAGADQKCGEPAHPVPLVAEDEGDPTGALDLGAADQLDAARGGDLEAQLDLLERQRAAAVGDLLEQRLERVHRLREVRAQRPERHPAQHGLPVAPEDAHRVAVLLLVLGHPEHQGIQGLHLVRHFSPTPRDPRPRPTPVCDPPQGEDSPRRPVIEVDPPIDHGC